MKKPLLTALSCCALFACGQERGAQDETSPTYLDTSKPLDTRVDDLIERMTLSEKISQLYNESPGIDRLGVAEYNWWNEALHGVARAGKATVFPQAIGLAATYDKELMHDVATVISDEARAKHHYFVENDVVFRYTGLTFWSPNVNIFRDPRWGRGQETYGEDPYLTSQLAVPFIKGLQGDDEKYLKTSAMAKHYAVHSGPEKSRHSDDYHSTPKDLYETYLPAFEAAVKDADVESIMCAYNRVNGDPACGSDMLLKDILRGDWQFDGHVVSDCGAIADFYDPNAHDLVRAPAQAAAWALKSGTDLNCGTGRLSTYANLHFALQRDMVEESDIDQAVKRLFKTRFKLGMFDPQEDVPYTDIPMSVVGSDKHLALTQQAAEQSMVLLKNDGLLPLEKGVKVAVIGPNATNPLVLVGNYHGEPINPVSPLKGIQQYLGKDNVAYAPGSALIADIYGHYQPVPAEMFFHESNEGALLPGLKARYYHATLDNGRDSEPAIERVDANIDFYWERSPLDNTVRDEFAIEWNGKLKPTQSGEYVFESRADIVIDGEPVEGSIYLEAGQTYDFAASTIFLRTWWGNPLEPAVAVKWVNTSVDLTGQALEVARDADVIIFAGGISPNLEGEEMSVELEGFDYGDRTDIDLPDEQQAIIRKLHALDKPMVLVNFSGSAMALNWEDDNLNAIVQGFYPGEATGTALARLLWGEYSPSGKLPITFYRSVDDLPGFKDYSMAGRTYKYYEGDVLYPFGHGLSYSDFAYRNLNVQIPAADGEGLTLTVDLTNTGDMNAADVSQVYLSLDEAPVNVPQRELVAFSRTQLNAGESQQVSITVAADQLTYVDTNGERKPYSGKATISVGSGQPGYVEDGALVSRVIEL